MHMCNKRDFRYYYSLLYEGAYLRFRLWGRSLCSLVGSLTFGFACEGGRFAPLCGRSPLVSLVLFCGLSAL